MARYAKFLIGLISLMAGAAAGFAVGDYKGYQRAFSDMINECVYGDTIEVELHLNTLKHFRTGKTKEGLEAIEARLDNQMIMFDPVTPYPLTEQTNAKVRKAIQDTKEYRSAYPRKSKHPGLDEMVLNLFKRH